MPIRLLQDMECSGKTVVIRQDLNVPMKDGRIWAVPPKAWWKKSSPWRRWLPTFPACWAVP